MSPRRARRALLALLLPGLSALAGCSGGGGPVLRVETEPDPARLLAAEADSLLRMARAEPAEPFWPCRLGERLAAADSLRAAAAALDRALAVAPLYAPAVSLRSKLHYDAGEYARGARLLEGALVAGATPRPPLQAALALHLDALGEFERVESIVDELGAPHRETASALGYLVLRGEDPFGADSLLSAAADAAPRSAAALNNRGIGRLYAGRPEAARQDFEAALALDPELAGAHYNLAILYLNYRFDETAAREHFTAYRRLARDDADPDDLGQRLAGAPAGGQVALREADDAAR